MSVDDSGVNLGTEVSLGYEHRVEICYNVSTSVVTLEDFVLLQKELDNLDSLSTRNLLFLFRTSIFDQWKFDSVYV